VVMELSLESSVSYAVQLDYSDGSVRSSGLQVKVQSSTKSRSESLAVK
jgi:hypothetical protein